MKKVLDFIKNKAIGYYIVAGVALLSLIVAIVFFATYNKPDLPSQMGNKADGLIVETIGIFLLAGFAVELAVLIVPQYRFIQIAAIAMFGLAFYKDVLVIPDFIVGKINNVEYNGGNFGLNMFFFVTILLIVIAAIVAPFLGFIKKEEETASEMKNVKGTVNLVRIGAGGALVLAAVLASSLISNNMVKKNAAGGKTVVSSSEVSQADIVAFDPITDEIREQAEAYDYDFDPTSVIIKEQEEYDYSNSDLNSLPTSSGTREGHNLVYYFEGSYAEGYQGDYSEKYASLYLWEDGLFAGKSHNDTIKGYWYNSSLAAGEDEEGNDIADCLNMVSNISKFESIITQETTGFYERSAYIFMAPWSGGTRSVIVNGYKYYPEVALAIDPSMTGTEFKVGDVFDRDGWVADRILKNLSYSAVFKASEVTWTDGTGIKNGQAFTSAGEYEVTAKWNGLEAKVTVTVTE